MHGHGRLHAPTAACLPVSLKAQVDARPDRSHLPTRAQDPARLLEGSRRHRRDRPGTEATGRARSFPLSRCLRIRSRRYSRVEPQAGSATRAPANALKSSGGKMLIVTIGACATETFEAKRMPSSSGASIGERASRAAIQARRWAHSMARAPLLPDGSRRAGPITQAHLQRLPMQNNRSQRRQKRGTTYRSSPCWASQQPLPTLPAMEDVTTTNPRRCPLCGGDNQCAMASEPAFALPQPRCWCVDTRFNPALLDRLPEPARGKSCICATCVSRSAAERHA